jgi:sarcosine oxidase
MPRNHYDVIVLGTGGVGSAALFHLARRGVRAIGIDRFPPGHDRGSSHGQTRIIRQAYFEHSSYVPMLVRAYDLWYELEQLAGQQLYFPVGLFECGPPDGEVIPGVRASAREHKLTIEDISPKEFAARFHGFVLPEGYQTVFEANAGFLLVERCVVSHAQQALRRGAILASGETAQSWTVADGHVTVVTDKHQYSADRLVITAGAWAGQVLSQLGLPLQVLRKALYWLKTDSDVYRSRRDCPGFFYELPSGIFYGFPQIDASGVKVAEHSGGALVEDPLTVDRALDHDDFAGVLRFTRKYMPSLTGELGRHEVCLYTVTPDRHFVVDVHPEFPQVSFAAGLSGHGFKFTSMLGQLMSQLALDGFAELDVDFLSCRRLDLKSKASE